MPPFKLIKLNNGTSIPQLGFGVYLIGTQSAASIAYQALKAGFRHIDTAQAYKNELEVAQGIKKWLDEDPKNNRRSDIYYTTKIASSNINYEATAKSVRERVEIAKQHIGYIDLVLLHAPLGNKKSRLGGYQALQEYVTAHPDNIKSLGVSNYGVHHLQELLNWNGFKIKPVLNQIELNPWLTHKDIVDFSKEHDIAIEAYSPLTRGERVDDPEITALAKKYNKTNGQILIKWSLQKGFIPIAKTETPARIPENFGVFDWELSDEDVKGLTHDDDYWVSNPSWDPTKYTG